MLTPGQIRLLSGDSLGVAAVGGAVRNSSGHWRVECRQVEDRMLMINDYNNNVYQLELSYYRLEMVPGYRHQYEDCMVCGYTGRVVEGLLNSF